jgi:hypothetical protein
MNKHEQDRYLEALYQIGLRSKHDLKKCSGIYENLAGMSENLADEYARNLEKRFNRIIEKFTISFLGVNRRNIYHPNNLKKTPIVYSRMELMEKSVRLESLENVKGSFNISPLHYHATIFVRHDLIGKMNNFLGDDTFKQFSEINNIQHSNLQITTNSKEFNGSTGLKGWINYINKNNHSFYYAYGKCYPSRFRDQPDTFVSEATGINLDLAA